MDDAGTVLDGLDRIERLQADGAPAGDLLDEVRRLLRAAERWAGGERDTDLDAALERCREALAGGELAAISGEGRPAGAPVERTR